jgi:D-beta-D-heptose 7-phosphate kinase/D-beta-D-heptose 1-phosphate adenosyltransferase
MKKPIICVIGDLILDHYVFGESVRISPEAPVPIVNVLNEDYYLGGAGNVVRNLKSFGAEVYIVGKIGNDINSIKIRNLFNEINVSSDYLHIDENYLAISKTRIIANNQQIVRIDKEEVKENSNRVDSNILESLKIIIQKSDVVIVSDYGKGLLTNNLLKNVFEISDYYNVKVIVDPKGSDFKKYVGAYLITPNKFEAIAATGIDIIDDLSAEKAILALKKLLNTDQQIITLSEKGIALHEKHYERFPALTKEIVDVSGAGDTVIAALAFQLSLGKNLISSIIFANKAASIVVKKRGTATVSLSEINSI